MVNNLEINIIQIEPRGGINFLIPDTSQDSKRLSLTTC